MMDFVLQDIITGERLQSIADTTVATKANVRFHRSMRSAGIRDIALFPGTQDALEVSEAGLARLRGKSSIFVYTQLLPSFFEQVLPRLDHSFVLISHNSDEPVDSRFQPQMGDDRIRHWFAQNALARHPKLTPLPIGLANAQWRHGRLRTFVAQLEKPAETRRQLAYVNFLVRTNPGKRGPLLERLKQLEMAWIAPHARFRNYLGDMAGCRWCVSPPGNGVDCHRTWEALYLGVLPIVERSVAAGELYRGLPVLEVDDLMQLSTEQILAETQAAQSKPTEWHRLTMSYWRLRIGEHSRA